MKFEKILPALRAGKKVRREAWYPYYRYIRLYNDEIIDIEGKLVDHLQWWEVLKTDWEIIED